MRRTPEGAQVKCAGCEKEFNNEDVFFVIYKYTKEIPTITCEKCGATIEVVPNIAQDSIEFNKTCNCPFRVSRSFLEGLELRYKKEFNSYCDECAKRIFPNVVFTELKE